MYGRGIEAFLAVASCHSLSGAAELLHITQSAVSHRLRQLEETLGMILVDRQKGLRRSELTQAGESLVPIAERWRQLWHETQHIRSSISTLELRVCSVDSVSNYLLPPLYKALIANSPPVHLRIYTTHSIEAYGKVERREVDVAFALQEQRHQHVKVVPFCREPMLIVRPRRGKSVPRMVRAQDLDPYHELFFNWGPSHQLWHDRTWDSLRTAKIELDRVTLIHALMEDPRHWALVPSSVADYFLNGQRLIVQHLGPPPPDRITFMITHRFPRIGARPAIEILETLARKLGFLGIGDQLPSQKDESVFPRAAAAPTNGHPCDAVAAGPGKSNRP